MKIVSTGSGLNSPGFYEKKRKRRRIKLILFITFFLTLIVATTYFSRQEQFLISKIKIQEEKTTDQNNIIQKVKNLLDGYYLWIIPRANALIYPRRNIEAQLLAEFPKFKSVDLNLEGFQTLVVSTTERASFALYCAHTSECFFLDEEGYIFAPVPSFSETVYFIYTTETPIENSVGKILMSAEMFRALSKFIKKLSILGIYPTALAIDNGEYRLSLPSGGEILWQSTNSLTLVYSNLEAFLSDESIKIQKDFLDKISQLDLRTENKVFWKVK